MAGIRGEPIRGGTRGGQGLFKWSDVAADKDRENFLGHSIYAPTGRWQNGRDVTWYNKDKKEDADEARREEIRKLKQAEEDALSAALGYAPAPRQPNVEKTDEQLELERIEKEQKRLEKAARKEGRRRAREERKAEKDARKGGRTHGSDKDNIRRKPQDIANDFRYSPRRRDRSLSRGRYSKSRSRSPDLERTARHSEHSRSRRDASRSRNPHYSRTASTRDS